ncbi:MAG: 2,3-bisphosphoglycerate-independent phosphoglycerate mutase [Cyanobacteria bacterium P01_F01_bin.42]
MAPDFVAPAVLVILDGWGHRETQDYNAIAAASTPNFDSLAAVYPKTLINTSGKDVGLPDGQMGNSEVGHLNIGAGRVVPQELVRISDAVETGTLLTNPALVSVCEGVKSRRTKLHLLGLCSPGGVHAHISHLFGLLKLAKSQGIKEVCIHAILDGRDTLPQSGKEEIQRLSAEIAHVGIGKIVTVSGRYYAMDRDNRWDRTAKTYRVMTDNQTVTSPQSAVDAIEAAYAQGLSDEFIEPVRLTEGAIEPEDGIIIFNFRPDRARQLTQALTLSDFSGFERDYIDSLDVVTFTQYDPNLPVKIAFEPQSLKNILAEVLEAHNLQQFRVAETEKYAHVTYFFNGGIEVPVKGEDRKLIPSPQVSTYDLAPAMSADGVTESAIAAIQKGIYSLVVINYANTDMVGHTGSMDAAIQAVETVDECLGRLCKATAKVGGTMLITADHGNAELMRDEHGNPWTAHTTNPVPFIFVEGEQLKVPGHGGHVQLREGGRLADLAPTILHILRVPQPPEMTGQSLIAAAAVEYRPNKSPVKLKV